MKNIKIDRRCGLDRREFHYTVYTPERRSGIDRRIRKNGKNVTWLKQRTKIEDYNKIWLKRNQSFGQIYRSNNLK